jgi:hypothetical protein
VTPLLLFFLFLGTKGIFFQTPNQTGRHGFDVQKVAKSTPSARFFVVIATPGFSKVTHGRKLDIQLSSIVVTAG